MEYSFQEKLLAEKANKSESESEEDFMNNAAKKYDELNPVVDLIFKMYQLPFPQLNETLQIVPNKKFLFSLPNQELSLIYANYGVGNLFYMLSRQKIYKILVALLLERKILLISRARNILTSIVFGLCGLINPFLPNHVVVPILSDDLISALGMESPYIIGCCNIHLALKDRILSNQILVVDVDEDLIFDEMDLPNLPYENLLDSSIHTFADELTRTKHPGAIPYYYTNKYAQYVDAIVHTTQYIFSTFLEDLSLEIKQFITTNVTECSTSFDHEAYLAFKKGAEINSEFYSQFSHTANFRRYLDIYCKQEQKKIEVEKKPPSTPLSPRTLRKTFIESIPKEIEERMSATEETFDLIDLSLDK